MSGFTPEEYAKRAVDFCDNRLNSEQDKTVFVELQIRNAIAAAVQAEREACEDAVRLTEHDGTRAQFVMRHKCAAAIRARQEQAR